MRYWVCQSCKEGHVDILKPTKCPYCGTVNGGWKSSDAAKMSSFRTYTCSNCSNTVEERRPPAYPCSVCGKKQWQLFSHKGFL